MVIYYFRFARDRCIVSSLEPDSVAEEDVSLIDTNINSVSQHLPHHCHLSKLRNFYYISGTHIGYYPHKKQPYGKKCMRNTIFWPLRSVFSYNLQVTFCVYCLVFEVVS